MRMCLFWHTLPAKVTEAKNKGWTVQKYSGSSTKTYAGLGDVNGDNKIDQTDLDTIVKIIMGQVNLGYAGDLNNDGKTDAADIVVMVNILNGLKRWTDKRSSTFQ